MRTAHAGDATSSIILGDVVEAVVDSVRE